MQNDLTFFTNEPGSTLLDRFKRTLRDVKLFDIPAGYFRTSGFDKLHEPFATINRIRILVGLNIAHCPGPGIKYYMVYKLYGLTEAEKAIIEEKT